LSLVLLAAAWCRITALGINFFADDHLFLDQVRRSRSLWALLTAPDPLGNYVRPVGRQLYFWVLAHLGHESPAVFHAANLVLYLIVLVLMFVIVRRLANTSAAVIASAILATHYAADVPVEWASGAQDLLALVGALGALALFLSGRRILAGLALFLGLLSKETVVFTPIIAVVASRRHNESWRSSIGRSWPLWLATVGCGALWVIRLMGSAGAREAVWWSLPGGIAAFAHLPQVLIGAEWRQGAETRFLRILPPLVPLLLMVPAILLGGGTASPKAPASERPLANAQDIKTRESMVASPVLLGVGWALVGTLPITAVTPIWSAYYYLFALCGLCLALGAWLASRPSLVRLMVALVLCWGSENARQLDEFITTRNPWSTESHVNHFYIQRANALGARYLGELQALHPSLPRGSTVFFADLPPFNGLQTADGPVVRWVYRDSSLRSFYLTDFTLQRARRGPFFFLTVVNDTLRDRSSDPNLLRSFAYSMILHRKLGSAHDALQLLLEQDPGDRTSRYWLALTQWALGDRESARASLARSGVDPRSGGSHELLEANSAIARRDTMSAINALLRGRNSHGLSVDVHSRLAAICLAQNEFRLLGVVEAFAVTVLVPSRADGWRKLASGQLQEKQYQAALESLRRYFLIGGATAGQDVEARAVMEGLRRVTVGDVAREALRDVNSQQRN
jgi:hypothetical protein